MKLPGWTRILQTVLALAGAVLLVASFASLSEGWLFQWRPQLFTDAPRTSKVEAWQVSEKDNAIPPLHTLVMVADSPTGVQIVGRFEIPRLHVSTVVVEGDGEEPLRLGVGHVPGSALAGPDGNTVLAGHRDTFFRCLRHIRIGDEVDFDVAGEPNRYRVTRTRIVPPSDVSVLNSSAEPQLTLITCYPFGFIGSAPKRLVVEARPMVDMAAVANP